MNNSSLTGRILPLSKLACILPRLFAVLFFFTQFSPSSTAQWTQAPALFGGEVFFIQQYAGAYWSGSETGLYRSIDGLQWARVTNLGDAPIIGGVADKDTLYILRSGHNTEVLTTTDGAQTWSTVEVSSEVIYNSAYIKKAGNALIVGRLPDGTYVRSKNNGASFQFFGGPGNPGQLDANGSVIAYFNGSNLSISQNSGKSFFTRALPPNNDYASQVVVMDTAIFLISQLSGGGANTMHVSYDVAQTWQPVALPAGFLPDEVNLRRSGKKGLIVQKYGNNAYTEDYGQTWQVFAAPVVPRQLLRANNTWLISSINGFYSSSDAGTSWTNASQDFYGHIVYRVYKAGSKVYAVTTNRAAAADFFLYVADSGSNNWTKLPMPSSSSALQLAFQGSDTIVAYDQLSLDGGLTWSYINYPNVSAFGVVDIDIHNNQAYVPNEDKIHIIPLEPFPTAQFIYGPSSGCAFVLFDADTLYVVAQAGKVYRQVPGSADWTALTGNGASYSNIYRVNGRFFQPQTSSMRYSDNGTDWQVLPTTGIPWSPANPVVINQMIGTDSLIIAAGSGIGLIFSNDKGSHWWPFTTGLPDAATEALHLAESNGKIYAAFYRQGLWQRVVQIGSSNGLVYRDDNQNGLKEPDEPALGNQQVWSVESDNLTLTDSLGRYQLVFDLPADTIRAILPVAYGNVLPAYRWVQGNRQEQDFGIWIQPDVTDLTIFAANTTAVRPGFTNELHLTITNAGTNHPAAAIGLKLPAGVLFLSAEPAPAAVSGDSITWELDSIAFLSATDILVRVQVNSDVALGQVLSFHTSVSPEMSDYTPVNNDFTLTATTVGSYDPNDKQVWPGAYISPQQVAAGSPLRYTIRFQNTGTYLAEQVRLIDTLDANLDLTTLKVLGTSHSYSWRILSGHVLEVLYEHIQLPDSNSNQAASHGFFSFSIQAKKNLNLGSLLRNRAYIYFDFNSPITTNTNITQVSTLSNVSGVAPPLADIQIIPNPANTYCTLLLPVAGGDAALFDAKGTRLRWLPGCSAEVHLEVYSLPTGVYYLLWQKDGRQTAKALVIIR